MESDRLKWNSRYESEAFFLGQNPSPFLVREMGRIMELLPGRRALDIASGEGRNSIFLAHSGFTVTGVDISEVGIAKGVERASREGVKVEFIRADLDHFDLKGIFDLVLNFNFLQRELIPVEVSLLSPGGLLLFDTLRHDPALHANKNPAFYLMPGELPRLFAPYNGDILFHEEISEGEMPTARLMFRKTS